ncbi:seryl-tRNA synthetase [Desulfobaculum xiamenense]|uniref:Serine--tRNA ligase n=1 Tax=Desulfobaculum xiamenense TaxID=995050 RepID=A0A846QLX4_9BACT|nr:serine--tRNA ligase [Desulfobaculum xiamenense]NJB69168.1 seryl-tRNA synthetase [Desulfobaculum xiamenense]
MLDIKFIRKNLDVVKDALAKRKAKVDVDAFLTLDARRRELLAEVEGLKAERNATSREVGDLKRTGGDASALMERMGEVNERIKALDAELVGIDEGVNKWLMAVPNIPHESTPVGDGEEDNPQVAIWGEKPVFDFTPREHWDIGQSLGGLDFERAARLAGSRFAVYRGWAARLERALAQFMLDVQTGEHGYEECITPYMVNRETMTGTGQLPKFEEDLFKIEGREAFMIPTAEVPLTNLYAGEVLSEDDLPMRFTAFTPCFRSEAGSYGKDTRGLIRQHQFHKVEMVRIEKPEDSYAALEEMRGHAEAILRKLGLHYRVVSLCTADIGFSAAKTYDLEVWLPGQDKFREISSCSNCEDFQARRMNMRFRRKGAKATEYVHTLNGSGLAVGRTFVAVLENYQQADGSLVIPEALRPYMGGLEIVRPCK